MGSLFKFVCTGCGYTAEVAGGPDTGEIVATNTIVCETCRCLYDVVMLDTRKSPPEKPERCPKSDRHKIAPWRRRGPCPKCGKPMRKGELVCLWD
jgi:hypothetical protein